MLFDQRSSSSVMLMVILIIFAATLTQSEFISGHAFQALAQWNAEKGELLRNSNSLKNGDAVFFRCWHPNNIVQNDHLKILRTKSEKDGSKFILFVHNCDLSFESGPKELALLSKYVSRIYSVNNACGQACMPLVQPIPLGFVDSHLHKDKAHPLFESIAARKLEKKHLLFMNFMIHFRGNDPKRVPCRDTFHGKPWVLEKPSGLSPPETYELTAKSKYVLSPKGAGIDCHRTYESIYLDAIPIVESSELNYLYRKMPILIVDKWSEITEEYLINNYAEHKKNLDEWKLKYPDWTKAEFWVSGSGKGGPFGDDYGFADSSNNSSGTSVTAARMLW